MSSDQLGARAEVDLVEQQLRVEDEDEADHDQHHLGDEVDTAARPGPVPGR